MENTGLLHDFVLFLTALCAAYAAWRGAQNGKAIETVKQQTNGMVSAVVAATAKSAHLAGVKEGIAAAIAVPPGAASPPPPP